MLWGIHLGLQVFFVSNRVTAFSSLLHLTICVTIQKWCISFMLLWCHTTWRLSPGACRGFLQTQQCVASKIKGVQIPLRVTLGYLLLSSWL